MTLILLSSNSLLMEFIKAGVAEFCPNVTIVGHCYSAVEGWVAVKTLVPDLVLIDLELSQEARIKNDMMSSIWEVNILWLTSNERLYKHLKRLGNAVLHIQPNNVDSLIIHLMEISRQT